MLKRLDANAPDFDDAFRRLLSITNGPDKSILEMVDKIIQDVQERGNKALLEYTNRFDRRHADINALEISMGELEQSLQRIPSEMRRSLEYAAERIRHFHQKQKQESWDYQDEYGNTLGQRVTPLERVGVYIPGGKATYPSSVLMNVIPARIAGVDDITMVVPTPDEVRNDTVLAAAAIVGVNQVFSVGGAQAIAALAYGAEPVPKVDKIVGPGNAWVTAAKRAVFGVVGIDMLAGPSEVVIVSDGSGDSDWAATDLFAQAEHDELASAVLICTDSNFIERVQTSVERLLTEMERVNIIRAALARNGAIIKVSNLSQAIELVNQLAPEHLELFVSDPEPLLEHIRHAGAIFMGHYAAEALGDYCAGPNHVLPTAGAARFSSPLGVADFQKHSSIIKCTPDSVATIAATAAALAHSEGLTAHARSAGYRGQKEMDGPITSPVEEDSG